MPKNTPYITAFLEDTKDGDVLKESAKTFDIPEPEVIKGGVKEALKRFVSERSPLYLIVDISNSELPLSDLTQLIEVCDPAVSIIAVGTKNDVGLYRDLMELGISDYIVRPLFPDILSFSLKGMLFGEAKGSEPKKRKAYWRYGVKRRRWINFFSNQYCLPNCRRIFSSRCCS